ncbi:MAG: PIN domain-containing protein [Caldilinea sp.]|nr:PIN domain-containing protein [Caldilinea sp.]MDW8442314.1 PIN domain-containing protein [Caldilineaceae bacterium]
MRYLLDTSALLAHYRQESGWEQVQALFEQEDVTLYLCVLSLPEFGRRLYDLGASPDDVSEALLAYCALFDELLPIDEQVVHKALEISRAAPARLPLIDALIAASAALRQACLVHRDRHLSAVPGTLLTGLDLSTDHP